MKKINIIRWDNGAGLTRSSIILAHILENAGFQVVINGVYSIPRSPNLTLLGRAKRFIYTRYLTGKHWSKLQLLQNANLLPIYDINIFFEMVEPMWFPFAHRNLLIPNQEWFADQWHQYLHKFDLILCQTQHAQEVFQDLGCKTEFISFTSNDCLLSDLTKNYNKYFHLAGRSPQKGTNFLIEVWKNHPDWPNLTIIQDSAKLQSVIANNITYINQYLDDELLRKYQNYHSVHLCPSEVEGFGHYIVEAMSCKSLILTTNAAPMNELVTEDRGILVNYHKSKTQRLGIAYYINPSDIETKIDGILGMDNISKKVLGANARDWYLENDRFFKQKIVEILHNI